MTATGIGVLVVDDQAPFRRAARAVLQHLEGFELLGEAESGEEAVSLAGDLHPALVLMDLNMPGMDGIEATRRLVAADPDVVVILCSTLEFADIPGDAAGSGAQAYLNKERVGVDALSRLWSGRRRGRFIAEPTW